MATNDLTDAINRYITDCPRFDGLNYIKIQIAQVELARSLIQFLGIPEYYTAEESNRSTRNVEPKQLPKAGWVYLAKNHRNGFIKIGFSQQPKVREKTLQSEEPEISFIRSWASYQVTETALHFRFREKRLRGEWFRLEDSDVLEIDSLFSDGKLLV